VGEGWGEGASVVPTPNTELRTPAAPHGATSTAEPAFQPRDITTNTKLTDLLYMTQDEFSAAFKGSAVKRAKRRGLLRNAIAALAERSDAESISALEHALNDPEKLVRDAAKWALGHINDRMPLSEHLVLEQRNILEKSSCTTLDTREKE
jgi:hypothetical protein